MEKRNWPFWGLLIYFFLLLGISILGGLLNWPTPPKWATILIFLGLITLSLWEVATFEKYARGKEKMFCKTYDWWCPVCEQGCDDVDETGTPLEEDEENYLLCPHCGDRLIGFDEKDELE